MGCGCVKHKTPVVGRQVDPLAQSLFAKTVGVDGEELVPICLKPTIKLPVMLELEDGQKIVVVPPGQQYQGVINVDGHNGGLSKSLRDAVMERYPNAFACADVPEMVDA